ncbi:MAG: hypothetical protein INR66_24810 [Gordonia polyisoprenivorans]|nr:hypothetical protein [Gordonia polyisoprenivorans]
MDEALTVTDARSQLTGLVRRVAQTPGLRFYIGPHRTREAVLMNANDLIPENVLTHLLTGFWCSEAALAIRDGAARGAFHHAGDPIGKVLAWLWRTNPDRTIMGITDYLYALRKGDPNAPQPPITLADVLGALKPAMPHGFETTEYDALCDRARTEVPRYAGSPVD